MRRSRDIAALSLSTLFLLSLGACTSGEEEEGSEAAEGETANADEADTESDSESEAGTTETGETTTESTETTEGMGCTPVGVPQGDAALASWLEQGSYLDWQAESAVHPSSGPHFGGVRTFVDDCLSQSLTAGTTSAVGGASVKELYGDGDEVLGWSVMLKVAEGEGGDSWYWYEIYEGQVYGDGVGITLCTNCHGGGQDFFLTPWPLQ